MTGWLPGKEHLEPLADDKPEPWRKALTELVEAAMREPRSAWGARPMSWPEASERAKRVVKAAEKPGEEKP